MRVWLPVASTVVSRDRRCFSPECLAMMASALEERALPVTFAFRQQVVGRTLAGKTQLAEDVVLEVQADLAPAFVAEEGLRALVAKGLGAGVAGLILESQALDTINVITRMALREVSVLPLSADVTRRVRFVENGE